MPFRLSGRGVETLCEPVVDFREYLPAMVGRMKTSTKKSNASSVQPKTRDQGALGFRTRDAALEMGFLDRPLAACSTVMLVASTRAIWLRSGSRKVVAVNGAASSNN
jgi:hypothetical protein